MSMMLLSALALAYLLGGMTGPGLWRAVRRVWRSVRGERPESWSTYHHLGMRSPDQDRARRRRG
ncbi:MAG: hypothetical protein Q8M88_16585 [Phenylobacterium sp.]|uniref:hypothetical protein n=1 Tax=Phenylobacterium sp. TaxID=1871053 RepID=UPI002736C351|nr:hypothetical protein [Phenylobacterium sp.]MDP3176047.1 hypothetical protein [Phenylobacterium sp.]